MLAASIGVLALAAAVGFTTMAYRRGWRWTGLPADPGDGTPAGPPRPAKTLWDWLQLLIVPLVLALAAFALNAAQADRDRSQQERRAAQERALEERQAARERAITEDRVREDTLRAYLQQMSDLIARRGLGSPRRFGADTESTLARTLTLIALRRLDGKRKGLVVQFLKEAELINTTAVWQRTRYGLERDPTSLESPKVSLAGADLRGAVMPAVLTSWADSSGPGGRYRTSAADLDRADLRNANFHGVSLLGATARRADLRGADFSGAFLGGTSFSGACLSGARFVRVSGGPPTDFSFTEGRGVDFSNAGLKKASFWRARLTDVKLSGASTSGVTWPRGWTSTGVRMGDAAADELCRLFRR